MIKIKNPESKASGKQIGIWLGREEKKDIIMTRGSRPKIKMVPVVGVEPTRYRYHRILSPARLPIPSHRPVFFILLNYFTDFKDYLRG